MFPWISENDFFHLTLAFLLVGMYTHFLLFWPTYRTAAMMKAMTATPPIVPTITAIMYFSENKGDQNEASVFCQVILLPLYFITDCATQS